MMGDKSLDEMGQKLSDNWLKSKMCEFPMPGEVEIAVRACKKRVKELEDELGVAYILISCGRQMDISLAAEWMKRYERLLGRNKKEPEEE
jgi:hypothetical protein